ncbi:DUF2971 domain-containing protein [Haloferax volcanii]|uniref:DUF2971 domain-containing protein n=1 Tax=Haloferax volcanii TaxID=2246 RepID=UPI00349F9343
MSADENGEQEFVSWQPSMLPDNAQVWRYIDFTQLVSIMEREALWFNRTDKFDDSFEGSFTRTNVTTRKSRYEDTEIPEHALEEMSEAFRRHRKSSYVSCWHANPYESAAMWSQYSMAGQGIAIQSTVGKLVNSITEKEGVYANHREKPEDSDKIDKIVMFGKVMYIDYDRHLIPENNLYAPIFHKRLSFKHEQEFRAVVSKFSEMLSEDNNSEELPPGMYIDIDVRELIDKIYISPTAPDWFAELVEQVREKYGLDCGVKKSRLDDDPVF